MFTVALGAQPEADVTIALSSSNTAEGTVAPSTLTFTSSNWNVTQTVTVTGASDQLFDGDVAYTIVTGATTSSSASYNGIAVSDVSVTNQRSLAQTAYVKASNTAAADGFSNVALSADGNTLAVGATGEDSAAVGIDGDQTSNAASSAGGVYVFARSGSTWTQQAYIKASNAGTNDLFGANLALSSDGSTLAVGAYTEASNATGIGGDQTNNAATNAGAVYVFTRASATWSQEAYVKASNAGASDNFGYSLGLSGDGNTLAVGAYGEASAATGINGNQASNTLSGSGAAYVFVRAGSTWTQEAYIKASNAGMSDYFGRAIAISADGDTVGVGAYYEGSAATGIGGNQLDNTSTGSGAAYIFRRTASVWAQEAYIKASNTGANDSFGLSVALSGDGSTFAVGAFGESSNASGVGGDQTNNSAANSGAVYVFARSGATWSQQAYVKASNPGANDFFGWAVALSADGNTLAAGATGEASAATGIGGSQTDNTATNSGAVYLLTRAGSTWTQYAYVKASNTNINDRFGTTVAMSANGSTVAVGAPTEASTATGVGGDQTNNAATGAGAAYTFTVY
ncbi:MAG: integrin [Sandaracinaceae bacterium]|nr:integrin [Sandaracinaceae bacterium]